MTTDPRVVADNTKSAILDLSNTAEQQGSDVPPVLVVKPVTLQQILTYSAFLLSMVWMFATFILIAPSPVRDYKGVSDLVPTIELLQPATTLDGMLPGLVARFETAAVSVKIIVDDLLSVKATELLMQLEAVGTRGLPVSVSLSKGAKFSDEKIAELSAKNVTISRSALRNRMFSFVIDDTTLLLFSSDPLVDGVAPATPSDATAESVVLISDDPEVVSDALIAINVVINGAPSGDAIADTVLISSMNPLVGKGGAKLFIATSKSAATRGRERLEQQLVQLIASASSSIVLASDRFGPYESCDAASGYYGSVDAALRAAASKAAARVMINSRTGAKCKEGIYNVKALFAAVQIKETGWSGSFVAADQKRCAVTGAALVGEDLKSNAIGLFIEDETLCGKLARVFDAKL